MHVIAGKALAFGEALKPEFKEYCKKIVANSKILCSELKRRDYKIVSGGTDTHLILIDLTNKNITGTIGIAEISKENNSKTVSQSGAFTGMKRNISATPNQFLGVIKHRAEAIEHQGSHRRG